VGTIRTIKICVGNLKIATNFLGRNGDTIMSIEREAFIIGVFVGVILGAMLVSGIALLLV